MWKILRDYGLLIITTPNPNSLWWRSNEDEWHDDPTHVSLKDKKGWLNLLKEKFEIIDVFHSGFWKTPYFSNFPVILKHLLIRIPFEILFYLGLRFPSIGEGLCIAVQKRVDDNSQVR